MRGFTIVIYKYSNIYLFIYIYIYMLCVCVYVYIYIYIHIINTEQPTLTSSCQTLGMNDPTSASSQMFTFGRATQSKGQGFLLQTRVSLSLVSQAAWKCRADFLPTWFHGTLKTHQNISVSTKGTCCFPPTGSSILTKTKPVHHQSSPHFPHPRNPVPRGQ